MVYGIWMGKGSGKWTQYMTVDMQFRSPLLPYAPLHVYLISIQSFISTFFSGASKHDSLCGFVESDETMAVV